mmetsp:Transcript_9013/g.12580  ORF Transcript_9013/g.12580 Transcript_9013/m.12580 type:complete len:732 (+) Transcript_9013:260-2455(+)|eukprot:CAMPEP_0184485630 /NCGR_PEP_ID=MMETSP0113_2-20130426/7210_1 /TAXON_ID=91329 /ORGANISM="Norrisiella sphaerica, Strain BC52" /LENGTH=731 /DNA_ID=CAMNT_0026867167 /DNA_START=179 /DNA_END=2374 /DNA_ORIENTATION=+
MSRRATLITGANGRIGAKVARRLARDGHRIVATDMLQRPSNPVLLETPMEYVPADLRIEDDVKGLPWSDIDTVVHLGAFPGPSSEVPPPITPDKLSKSLIGLEDATQSDVLIGNIGSTWHVFAAASAHSVSRIVFSSSLFSYGYSHIPEAYVPRYLPIDEAHPQLPHETYGLSKLVGELSADLFARCLGESRAKTEFISLEFTNIVKAENFSTLPWAVDSSKGHPGTLLMWPYCHEDDVIDAHVSACSCPFPDSNHNSKGSFAGASGHVRLILAADDTRYDTPTLELLTSQFPADIVQNLVPESMAATLASFPYTSPVCNKRAKAVLPGWQPRSFRDQRTDNKVEAQTSSGSVPLVAREREGAVESNQVPGVYGDTWVVDSGMGDGSQDLFVESLLTESHQVLENIWVRFKDYGIPPREDTTDPVKSIVVFTSFDAGHPGYVDYLIQEGGALDPAKHRVVVINHLGNGQSFSPSHAKPESGQRFPDTMTYGDNIRMHVNVLDHLGIDTVSLAYGYSMGAMQSFYLAAMHPGRVENVAAVCGGVRAQDTNKIFLNSLMHCVYASKGWNKDLQWFEGSQQETKDLLKAFARIYAGWGLSSEFYEEKVYLDLGFENLEDFSVNGYEKGFANGDVNNLLAQVKTWCAGDLSLADVRFNGSIEAAMKAITARVVWMPCTTDRYFLAGPIERECKVLRNASFDPIRSPWGHRAGDPWRKGQEDQLAHIQAAVTRILG